ncbi:MAG: transglutaminase family protein [Defluviicoccus sp.]|nr:transglutaminase family protein [Defluviicoccus sp.]
MTMHIALTHRTTYRYSEPINLGPQIVRLRPAPHCRAKVLAYSLKISPATHFINWQQDPQSNYLARLVFPEKTSTFDITVDLVAEMAVINPFDFFLEPQVREFPFTYAPWQKFELEPYLNPLPAGPRLRQWLSSLASTATSTVDFLVNMNQRLEQEIEYVIRMEAGVQTCEETLERARGSCRDSAWLLVQILRHLGLAARFVSGYLIQLKPDVKPLDGPAGAEEDFTDLHAWAEVYLPGAGWIGLDPTSGLLAGEGHLPLACTPDPESAAPVSGTLDPCDVTFAHEMAVGRIKETPRVTKPYTEEQWSAILDLGKEVDRRLVDDDVRLTMGGEPTFVSIDDMEGDEWNTAAVGPDKRKLAVILLHRLRERFAPEGLLHFGQGKWYPGESLPRWAFSLYWRGDRMPLWHDRTLIAGDAAPGAAEQTPTIDDADRFIRSLAETLGIDPDYALPAYEDPLPHLSREQNLPENVDAFDSKLESAEERARLVRVLERGLANPVGFVLPVQRWQAKDRSRWRSERWSFRRHRMFLIPGDSPIGYRLPLESLPWVPPEAFPFYSPADPFAQRGPLPRPAAAPRSRVGEQMMVAVPEVSAPDVARQHQVGQEAGSGPHGAVRTAIGIEPRDGALYIFLPPTEEAEEYIALVAAVEDTASKLKMPVRLEGYGPPADPRLNIIKVTPDPGVIEVNIHPAHSWDELVAITTALYEDARLTRLGTEKFMIDGRHTGTGGGNHIVVGGPSAAESPFLRRPDLLRSLIGYWQNHPSLSYLFSGLFLGPTSQAPRVDEARNDQLYELEIAFAEIPDSDDGETAKPWLVDRIFRNLLIDVTGNTHRAEICIDKLYSPEGPNGRLGLVEFRAFEMPPHARMSIAQQLVLRALIAWFWRKPWKKSLVRWGTSLHDRFMLPHFVWKDFVEVLDDLCAAGFALKEDWFAPHFEFRFPVYGRVEYDGVTMELRQALEPWHVMGEQGAMGGTARFVDSSVERLQIRVSGLTEGRHVVACNGRRIPLRPTGTRGEAVAGVRFRAWQPPNCLHPTLGVDAPLIFDLFDTWSGRSLGGCTYHVAHPGGRSFETYPVNAFEAEARRMTRFQDFGHTPGQTKVPVATSSAEYPVTVDLRRHA